MFVNFIEQKIYYLEQFFSDKLNKKNLVWKTQVFSLQIIVKIALKLGDSSEHKNEKKSLPII